MNLRDFIEILFAAMGKLPYIGSVISVMNATPFVNVFVATSTAAVVTYIINNMLNNTPFSKYCNNYGDFTKCYIPYSCKLLFQELQSMSMYPRILLK